MTQFFEIDFLEAGEKGSGDAIALRYREDDESDYFHVVDGGYTDDGKKLIEHIEKFYDRPERIDHVVLTHPDGDHAAGLKAVLKECEVGTLWMNRPWEYVEDLLEFFEYDYTTTGLVRRLRKDFPHLADLEDLANEQGISIRSALQGEQIGAFTVLAPSRERYLDLVVDSEKTPEPEREASIVGSVYMRLAELVRSVFASWGEENLKGESEGTSRENEMSIVQFAQLCDEKILLTGDAGIEALKEAYDFLVNELDISLPGINRFQVPHHGSRRNLSSGVLDDWLGHKFPDQAERSKFTAIISANQQDEEHPKKDVVRAFIHRGARVIQTKGTIRTSKNAPHRDGWSPVEGLDYPEETEE